MPLTYVRFVTAAIDTHSGRRQGLFRATGDLIDANQLQDFELEELRALRQWFDANLKKPDRFARSRKTGAAPRAIGWFKSTATEYVSRMHAMCRILNEHGIRTQMLTSDRPGYIVFEDEHQIAAIPVAETAT